MSRLHLALCLMMVFSGGLLASCSNDADGDDALCVTKEDCKPHQLCKDGACISVSEAKLNEPCHETLICVEPLVCRNDVCVEAAASCKTKDECPNDLVCRDGVCVEAAASCKTKDECPNDLVCRDGVCVEAAASCKTKDECPNDLVCRDGVCIKTDGACKTKDECPNDLVCRDGVCVDPPIEYAKEGESCMNLDCEPGTLCSWNYVCQRILKRGEACEIDDFCTDMDQCIDGFCKGAAYPGELCDAYVVCYGGTCRDGVCLKTVDLFEPCNDDDGPICSSSLICVDGQCVELKGDCNAENPKCNGDSYCCLEASCGEHIGKCVPYNAEGHDETCRYVMKPGIFEAAVQCEWIGGSEIEPASNQVMSTIMVADLPFDSNGANEIVLKTFLPGVIRIFNGETCEEWQSISGYSLQAEGNLALADLDGDGLIEIVVDQTGSSPAVSFKWDEAQQKYVEFWKSSGCTGAASWAGPSIHDIDDDGLPEVFVAGCVYDGKTGIAKASAKNYNNAGSGDFPIIGDLNNDGNIEWLTQRLERWNASLKVFELVGSSNFGSGSKAYADFGSMKDGYFSFDNLDGMAEVVSIRPGNVTIQTLDGTIVMSVGGFSRGGPPNIGDFDGDGFPEIGFAGGDMVAVIDPRCKADDPACEGEYILWKRVSQDLSSGVTGTSVFDFDGDGAVEVVYGDECYTRVYDGKTGEVLFSSYRTSNTAYENPTIVDCDNDGSTEILIGGDSIAPNCPTIDPSHHGTKCIDDSDCYSKVCVAGYCRCTEDGQCNWQMDSNGQLMEQYRCTTPLAPQKLSDGQVCRAYHAVGLKKPGFVVLRDRLDRWMSSRGIWNQHAYSITNINDDGSVPKTSEWLQNFLQPNLNNFRQQAQGSTGAGAAPDITGRFISSADVCKTNEEGQIVLSAQVCNRGTKAVGRQMPAVFYEQEATEENILCVSYTDGVVPVSGCKMVSCEIDIERAQSLAGKKILLLVNDDGKGGKTTVECREDNNTDEITIEVCAIN